MASALKPALVVDPFCLRQFDKTSGKAPFLDINVADFEKRVTDLKPYAQRPLTKKELRPLTPEQRCAPFIVSSVPGSPMPSPSRQCPRRCRRC